MELRFVTKWEKEGRKLGRIEGRKEGVQNVALLQLQKRFGALNEKLAAQIAELPAPQLTELSLALLDFRQPQDLTAWLKQQASPKKQKSDPEK